MLYYAPETLLSLKTTAYLSSFLSSCALHALNIPEPFLAENDLNIRIIKSLPKL